MIYTQNEFRQFLKCKRLFSYQPEYDYQHIEIKILEDLFARISSLYLKNNQYSIDSFYSDCITILNKYNKEAKLLQSQYESILNSLSIYGSQIFNYFNINEYLPVCGPIYLNKIISKTTIKLKISGIFRNKNQTLHLVYFSPYTKRLDILNDPIVAFTAEEFFQFIKDHKSDRPKITIHIFYYKDYKDIGYINYKPKNNNLDYTNLVKDIEVENYFPVVPCFYKCKYKNKCEGER